MSKQSGVTGTSEEAARKLLEGADPASLGHDELLAGIEALPSHRSIEAANLLVRLSGPKDVAKAARRALFKLRSQGILPSEAQPAAEPAETSRPVAPIRLVEAQVSSYDPKGTRALSILAEKPFTGLVNLFAVASDTEGLLDAELSSTTKKAFHARLRNFTQQYGYIELVDLPADYANQLVHRCASLNEKADRPLPQDFTMWKTFGALPPEPPLAPLIYSELSQDEIRERVPLDETKDLASSEFEAWAYDEERLKEYLTRLDTARGGPLVLSADAQKEREKGIVDEATDAIFQGDELRRAKERLEETAYFLLRQGQRPSAERCFRAALSIEDGPPRDQPFLREIVTRSIHELTGEADGHQHEHDEERRAEPSRTESGLILPA